jgi:membrane-associated protease RseP (regulator of RpoE activity)
MSFNQDFEAEVNSNMDPSRQSISKDVKAPIPTSPRNSSEAEDREFNEKMAMKDQHQPPPRFSTIFDTKGPATPAREFESYPQPPARKAGIYIAKPLFWALFAIFLFESAVLFAYTVIGLVSNMSSKLVHVNSAGAVVAGCDCNTQPINISPNFFMQGGPQASVVETTTASTTASTTLTTSISSSSSSTSHSVSAGVSELADIIKNIGTASTSESSTSTHTPTTRVVTVTPPGPTIKSTTILTVDASGNTLPPRPTVTSTKVVAPTLDTRDEAPSPSVIPTMSLSLKSHQELASQPTQEAETTPAPTQEPAPSEPTETVSTPTTTVPEPKSTCTKSNHLWGASGRIWGGVVCK